MKSIRDAARLYRTLIAEGLRSLADDETFERLGYRADSALWRLGNKIQPRVEGPGLGAGWTDLGYISEDGVGFAQMVSEDIARATSDAMGSYIDRMVASVQVPGFYLGPEPSPHEETADIRALRWNGYLPSERTKAEQAMRDALTFPEFNFKVPSFVDLEPPAMPDFQSMVNDMVIARNDIFEGRFRKTFVAGVDPESEWTYVDRIYLDGLEADSVDPLSDNAWRWITGIPMYPDPDDDTRLRMKTADLLAAPNGDKIVEYLLRDATPDEE